jgi:hypothetical protein
VCSSDLREFSAAETPPDFVPFTTDEVAHHRRPPLTEVNSVRRDLLRAIAAREATTAPSAAVHAP